MNAYFRPPVPEPAAEDCLVALLDARGLNAIAPDAVALLSGAELRTYNALQRPQRRTEWLAARVAAKSLFLHRQSVRPAGADRTAPRVMQLSEILFDNLPLRMYRSVEILADREPPFAAPVLRWRGRIRNEIVSLAHAGNDVCACLSTRGAVGVDVERVTQRADAFYRRNFTAGERAWANEGERIAPRSKDWLFTLLWTIKEAALKAGALMPQSPWSFAGIGLEGLPVPRDVVWCFRQGNWGERFGQFTAIMGEMQGGSYIRVAYGGTREFALTIVKPIWAPTSTFRGGGDDDIAGEYVGSEHP